MYNTCSVPQSLVTPDKLQRRLSVRARHLIDFDHQANINRFETALQESLKIENSVYWSVVMPDKLKVSGISMSQTSQRLRTVSLFSTLLKSHLAGNL